MPTSALIYLSKNLGIKQPGKVVTDFALEWKGLSDDDKILLKAWAAEEMDLLGVE